MLPLKETLQDLLERCEANRVTSDMGTLGKFVQTYLRFTMAKALVESAQMYVLPAEILNVWPQSGEVRGSEPKLNKTM